jgi:hypothetical protein
MKKMDANQTVRQALSNFYDVHDFGEDGGINEKIAFLKFGFIQLPIPNSTSRRNNVYHHDIGHLITENDTTWKGESAVSAWEIASGGWGNHYTLWLMTLWATGLGVVFYTENVVKSFKSGLVMRNTFTSGLAKEEIFETSASALKTQLSGFPKSEKNPYFWLILSAFVFIFPFLVVGFVGFILINTLTN